MTKDLRHLLGTTQGRPTEHLTVLPDSRTPKNTPESGQWVDYDGAKGRKDSKVHVAVNTLGHSLAALSAPISTRDWAQVDILAKEIPAVTG